MNQMFLKKNEDCFIAIGNSGVWNIMKNSEVMEFIFNKIENNDKSNYSRLLIDSRMLAKIGRKKLNQK